MPGQTPIYGFPYPCPGETISSSSFSRLANAIDAKMADVNADMVFALNRRNVDLLTNSTQVITGSTPTVLTTTDSTYVFPVSGVWVVWVGVTTSVPPPAIQWQRATLQLNGVAVFAASADSEANNPNDVYPAGPMIVAAGDVITTLYHYVGTGTQTVETKLSAKLLCRIP